MKYNEYKVELLACMNSFKYLCKTPCKTINGIPMMEAPPLTFWDGIHPDYSLRALESIDAVARDLEIMQLKQRLKELKG